MSFRLVPKSVTLNGVMAVILRYFSEFGYLPGVLRKSSISHLLISSCVQYNVHCKVAEVVQERESKQGISAKCN